MCFLPNVEQNLNWVTDQVRLGSMYYNLCNDSRTFRVGLWKHEHQGGFWLVHLLHLGVESLYTSLTSHWLATKPQNSCTSIWNLLPYPSSLAQHASQSPAQWPRHFWTCCTHAVQQLCVQLLFLRIHCARAILFKNKKSKRTTNKRVS